MSKQNYLKHNLLTVCALWRRDLYVLYKERLKDGIINNLIILFCLYALFGIFSLHMGIASETIPAILIGILIGNLVYLGWSIANETVFDMEFSRSIDYQIILPLTLNWFLFRFVGRYVMELFLTMLPGFVLAKILVGSQVPLAQINWITFMTFWFLTIFFIALFFLSVTFGLSFDWFRLNIWQRVLWPMNAFGGIFYTWKRAYAFNPLLGQLLLLNPQIYLNEGLRATLLNPHDYLNIHLSIGVIGCLSAIGTLFMRYRAEKKLDCVV